MSDEYRETGEAAGDERAEIREPERSEPVDLSALDPGTSDDLYWPRFHAEVMRAAEPALEARRSRVSGGLGEELLRLGRWVVPGVTVAASVAAVLLVSPTGDAGGLERALLGVDEILMERVTGRAAELSVQAEEGIDRSTFMIALEEGSR